MKKLVVITISLCAVLGTAVFSGAAAYAESADGGLDVYPTSFTRKVGFENLQDYAVGTEKYAFLENNVIYEYDGAKLQSFKDGSIEVTGVYYKDGATLCYGSADGNIYEYGTAENPVEIKVDKVITDGEYIYSKAADGVEAYKPADGETGGKSKIFENFSKPKAFNDKVYAVNDNKLFKLNGLNDPEELILEYPDYSSASKINTGSSAEVIRQLNLTAPQFVSLKNGAFMTEVNIDEANGEYFKTSETVKAGSAGLPSTALLLAKFGTDDKISLVTVNGKFYLMHSDNAPANPREAITAKELGATVTVDDAYIYSAPCVCKSTQLVGIKSGDALKVTGEVTKEDNPELALGFYKVEYTDEEGTAHTGYVPANYVSPFAFIENPPVETPDPDYTEDNLIKTVVLVILVVILVLAAGGYIVYALWTGKFKKKDKDNK